jgi:hypothetical protein
MLTPENRARGGKRPGAGRKPNAARDELRLLLDEMVTTDERKQMLAVCRSYAQSGSLPHLQFLFSYLYGKPVERIEHTGEDGDAIRIRVEYDDINPAPTATP